MSLLRLPGDEAHSGVWVWSLIAPLLASRAVDGASIALWCWTGKTVRIPLPPRRGITLPYGGESIERQLDWWGVPLDPLFGESMVGVGSARAVPEKHGEVAEWTKALAC